MRWCACDGVCRMHGMDVPVHPLPLLPPPPSGCCSNAHLGQGCPYQTHTNTCHPTPLSSPARTIADPAALRNIGVPPGNAGFVCRSYDSMVEALLALWVRKGAEDASFSHMSKEGKMSETGNNRRMHASVDGIGCSHTSNPVLATLPFSRTLVLVLPNGHALAVFSHPFLTSFGMLSSLFAPTYSVPSSALP